MQSGPPPSPVGRMNPPRPEKGEARKPQPRWKRTVRDAGSSISRQLMREIVNWTWEQITDRESQTYHPHVDNRISPPCTSIPVPFRPSGVSKPLLPSPTQRCPSCSAYSNSPKRRTTKPSFPLFHATFNLASENSPISVYDNAARPFGRLFIPPQPLAPVVVGPLIVLFIRRIVQLWYSRKEANEEKTLQHLLKQQRTKVEEIKKKTNYYSTRDLLSKYDEATPLNTPQPPQGLRQRVNPASGQPPMTPGDVRNATPPRPIASGPNGMNPGPSALINPALHGLSPSPFLATPTRKQWYDKLADALLGADDQAPPSSRYALICEKCFKHNGLLPEAMWEDAQFRCVKCDHLNASVRSKREARRSVSPGAASVDGSVSAPRTPSPVRNTAGRAPSSAASSPAASPPRSTADESQDIADRMDED